MAKYHNPKLKKTVDALNPGEAEKKFAELSKPKVAPKKPTSGAKSEKS
jgi:hypothetical protein